MPSFNPTVLSKQIVRDSKDGGSVTWRVRVKRQRGQSIYDVVGAFYHSCLCSYDCCGHIQCTPWNHTVKNVKRREFTFEMDVYRNI